MKVVLAYRCHPEGAQDPFTSLLPVGLLSLDAVLRRAGHQVTLANFSGYPWKEVRRILKEQRPEVLGISQFTHNRAESLELARVAKGLNPRCLVLLGGPHATHAGAGQLAQHPEVDVVVLGEGEETLSELLQALAAGRDLAQVAGLLYRSAGEVLGTPARAPIADLDALPLPAAAESCGIGVDYRRQLEFIITSRGCPASCLFCSSPLFWGRGVRFRAPASVVEELRLLRERFGLVYFSLRDDTFTADRARVLEICRLLEEAQLGMLWNCQSRVTAVDQEMLAAMKRAGCECIQFGVESGSPAMLKALGKRITPDAVEQAAAAVRNVGLNLSIYLITGIPGETEQDLKETQRLIERIRPQDGQVSPLVYYPGTQLFSQAVRKGAVSERLFEDLSGEGFLVRQDPFVERSRRGILKTLEKAGAKARYTRRDFEKQRELVGYSFVTEMLSAESLEESGEVAGALELYREMTRREPKNPWGLLLEGGLQGRLGEFKASRQAYLKVLLLVPRHLPALLALGELALELDKPAEAADWFGKALEMAPGDAAAEEGLQVARALLG
ncbi:B12-binding domain-containing radical SAM protein [Geomonas silvestris]|uniref:B12-binding domain-containing radical SAM protein n=1 Tax=Geomonas silvestris TaxID=2740184 RepID=A0A6V8MPP1_9BACT|nr:radical SAM protein [Geomonas silvestris]GFO61857.1 B12-binding domain-containing radical SAM protein [Geomonas silvestris]